MNNMLEQIGITKEELIERIVNKALGTTADYRQTGEETWVEIPFSDVVDKKITNAIGNIVESMKPLIGTRIETIMTEHRLIKCSLNHFNLLQDGENRKVSQLQSEI